MIPQVLISGNQNLEAVFLSGVNQLTILQLRPAALEGGGDFMLREKLTQRDWRALIEKDPHLSRSQSAARRMLKYSTGLLKGNTGEPFQKLSDLSTVFEVLE